jgi:hypothetical protein
MKLTCLFLMLCALTGCAQKDPFAPAISGALEPINTSRVIHDVGNQTDH